MFNIEERLKDKEHQEILTAFNWMLSFFDGKEWELRRDEIENYLRTSLDTKSGDTLSQSYNPISITDDRIGWYLYLVERYLFFPLGYETHQGARVVPIFNRIGRNLETIKSIQGIEDKIKELIFEKKDTADSTFFEILTALLWIENGATNVEFLQESPTKKTPDIKAELKDEIWFVECKRLSKTSKYSERERSKWLRLWNQLRDCLTQARLPLVFDITFHTELFDLDDDFLLNSIWWRLSYITGPTKIIDNDVMTVLVKTANQTAIRDHMNNYSVKYPSEQLNQLICEEPVGDSGFSCVVEARYLSYEGGPLAERYIDDIGFVCGSKWKCDAEESINRKARDVRRQLSRAVQQLPINECSVVHIGFETLDGLDVEKVRFERIISSIGRFNPDGRDLKGVYCHLFQSYAPIDQPWVIDETTYKFKTVDYELLEKTLMIVPEEEATDHDVHWLKDSPF